MTNTMAYLLMLVSVSPGAAPPPMNQLPLHVLSILEKADSIELYSLDRRVRLEHLENRGFVEIEDRSPARKGAEKKAEKFQSYKVLGKTTIKDEKVRGIVLRQIRDSFPAVGKWVVMREIGVVPWYGLRVKHGDRSVDLLLNFRWGWLTAYVGGKSLGEFAITDKARASLDRLLEKASVPIAEGRKEENKPSNILVFLTKAKLVELYSLEPWPRKSYKGEEFRGYQVLGKIAIKDDKTRKDIVDRIVADVVPDVYRESFMAPCFKPRHAFRMEYEGEPIDILICFECHRIKLTLGDTGNGFMKLLKKEARWDKVYFEFGLDESDTKIVLDKLLRDAKIPLAKKREAD